MAAQLHAVQEQEEDDDGKLVKTGGLARNSHGGRDHQGGGRHQHANTDAKISITPLPFFQLVGVGTIWKMAG